MKFEDQLRSYVTSLVLLLDTAEHAFVNDISTLDSDVAHAYYFLKLSEIQHKEYNDEEQIALINTLHLLLHKVYLGLWSHKQQLLQNKKKADETLNHLKNIYSQVRPQLTLVLEHLYPDSSVVYE